MSVISLIGQGPGGRCTNIGPYFINGVSATKVLWVEDDQNAIVKVPIRSLVTCDLDLLAPRRVTYALLQDEGG